ncbi:dipicolinate synthase subunit B [Ligaoa zhengdingensis]|uniref:dipicolinate synthase subunit B n=1 Tax=Ligaoa zhengdingensis TaxID=2763658 RepID=UPI0031BB8EE1
MNNIRVGFAICGSFCTFSKVLPEMQRLVDAGYEVWPIMSAISCTTDTRFGKAADFVAQIEEMCGRPIIKTIKDAEPIGPKALLDALVIAPCTGNTLGKLANGITDTSVTMACKAHLRNARPVVIAVSTNDGLGASARNIGQLLNVRNLYFVPYRQDDCIKKPTSLVADFTLIQPTLEHALKNLQLQPIIQ